MTEHHGPGLLPAGPELLGLTPAGLPFPESSAPTGAGANDIKALALAVDTLIGGAWLPLTPPAGYTGAPQVRLEGASAVLAGTLTGTFTGSPTILAIPVGYRPVFPPGSGLTYYQFIVAAASSGNTGYLSIRVWANGNITVVAVNGVPPSVDIASVRYPYR